MFETNQMCMLLKRLQIVAVVNNILTPNQFHHILHISSGHNMNFILNIMFCKSRSQITVKQTTQSNVYTHI